MRQEFRRALGLRELDDPFHVVGFEMAPLQQCLGDRLDLAAVLQDHLLGALVEPLQVGLHGGARSAAS